MNSERLTRIVPAFFSLMAVGFLGWGFALNLTGHESVASWSLITAGAVTASGVWAQTRRKE